MLARAFVSGHARQSAWHQQEEAEATADAEQVFHHTLSAYLRADLLLRLRLAVY